MSKIRTLFLVICLLFSALAVQAFPEVLNIGLFYKEHIKTVSVSAYEGSYDIYADGKLLISLKQGQSIVVSSRGDKVSVKKGDQSLGHFKRLWCKRQGWGNTVKIKRLSPTNKSRIYNDNIRLLPAGEKLKIINDVYIEHYVAGVVEAESGRGKTLEYYKVQAIIARTYALSHLDKFKAEGFQLCDKVDCQVYKGKSRFDDNIPRAVYLTRGMVLVDSEINLITAAFHSNSGGLTSNSEDVWTRPVPYLKSRPDSFSMGQPNFTWTRKFTKDHWFSYLHDNYGVDTNDPLIEEFVLDYCPTDRTKFFLPFGPAIPLTQIRRDLGLKSTFFNIRMEGDMVIFEGKGFGHGVGLSQEGAMKMALLGFSFTEILHYYYRDVHLVDLSVIDFFREE